MNEPIFPPPPLSDDSEPGKLLRADVSGAKPSLWIELRPKLIEAIKQCLDFKIEKGGSRNIEDELRSMATGLLDYAKHKLAMPEAEYQKVIAEVSKIYAEKQRDLAEARKTDAEAEERELKNQITQLRFKLGMCKAMLVGEKDQEALLLGRRITAMLKFLKELQEGVV